MKRDKFIKNIFIFLFIIFISLYISQSTGYYEYEQYKKVSLTNEQIKKFEQDVREGKNVDVTDYIESTKKEYGNNISNIGLTISKKIEKYVKKTINNSFKALEDIIDK